MLPNDPATLIRQTVISIEPGLIAIRRDPRARPKLRFEEIERRIGFGARALPRAAPELLGAEIPA